MIIHPLFKIKIQPYNFITLIVVCKPLFQYFSDNFYILLKRAIIYTFEEVGTGK